MRCALALRHSGKISQEKTNQYCLLVSTKLRTYLIETKLCIKIKLTQNFTENMDITMLEAKE